MPVMNGTTMRDEAQTQPGPPIWDAVAQTMPFDQVGRYQMIREAITAARPALGGGYLRILDVGGFFRNAYGQAMLPIQTFLPDDDCTVIDQHPITMPGYIQGDGRRIAADDSAFDVVVSCDTLEHIPRPDRPAFWHELLRVARYGVILAAPFATPEVIAAEEILFTFIQTELGFEQPQLQEHRTYGLPTLSETRALLDAHHLDYHVYPSGYLHAWLVLMLARHYLAARTSDVDTHQQCDAYYTRFLSHTDRREPAYRHLLLVNSHTDSAWLALADAALAPTLHDSPPENRPDWRDLSGWLLSLLAMPAHQQSQPLIQTTATQADTIHALQHALAQRDAQIADLHERCRWLEQQSSDARRALSAVEQGRILRLVRWFQRRRRK